MQYSNMIKTMRITTLSLSLALMGLLTTANAQERLELPKAKQYAQLTRQNPKALKKSVLPLKVDLEHPIALFNENYGGLLIPRAGLSDLSPEDFGDATTAIGELWFYNLAPEQNGWATAESKLDIVSLNSEKGHVKVPRCILAVSQSGDDAPVLKVYSKGKKPLFTVPITELSKTGANTLDMTATEDGQVTLSMGNYQASFRVAELILY